MTWLRPTISLDSTAQSSSVAAGAWADGLISSARLTVSTRAVRSNGLLM